jgi:hypothetical protein
MSSGRKLGTSALPFPFRFIVTSVRGLTHREESIVRGDRARGAAFFGRSSLRLRPGVAAPHGLRSSSFVPSRLFQSVAQFSTAFRKTRSASTVRGPTGPPQRAALVVDALGHPLAASRRSRR